jgi:hypothetical protein
MAIIAKIPTWKAHAPASHARRSRPPSSAMGAPISTSSVKTATGGHTQCTPANHPPSVDAGSSSSTFRRLSAATQFRSTSPLSQSSPPNRSLAIPATT